MSSLSVADWQRTAIDPSDTGSRGWVVRARRARAGGGRGPGLPRLAAVGDGDGPDGSVPLELLQGLAEQRGCFLGLDRGPRPQDLADARAGGPEIGGQEGADPAAPLADGQGFVPAGDPLQPCPAQ